MQGMAAVSPPGWCFIHARTQYHILIESEYFEAVAKPRPSIGWPHTALQISRSGACIVCSSTNRERKKGGALFIRCERAHVMVQIHVSHGDLVPVSRSRINSKVLFHLQNSRKGAARMKNGPCATFCRYSACRIFGFTESEMSRAEEKTLFSVYASRNLHSRRQLANFSVRQSY